MNLIDAIKSGKPFNRKEHLNADSEYYTTNDFPVYLEIDSILANDWEIEEEKIELTKSELHDVLFKYNLFLKHENQIVGLNIEKRKQIYKELGFKE